MSLNLNEELNTNELSSTTLSPTAPSLPLLQSLPNKQEINDFLLNSSSSYVNLSPSPIPTAPPLPYKLYTSINSNLPLSFSQLTLPFLDKPESVLPTSFLPTSVKKEQSDNFVQFSSSWKLNPSSLPLSPQATVPLQFSCLIHINNGSLKLLKHSLRSFVESNGEYKTWKRIDPLIDKTDEYNVHFIYFPYVLQEGPQCGFAALSMIAASVGISLSPNYLVSEAKSLNITNCGEMYSARNMANFAADLFSRYFFVTLFSHSIRDVGKYIQNYIQESGLILIPYDSDFNHEPCLKKGHRAHWAIICGYIDGEPEDKFYIIARHGKSRFPVVWEFTDLQKSNDNLCELGPKRQANSCHYKIPEEGVKEGLASKWILFQRKNLNG